MSIKLKDTILDYIDKAYKDSSGNVISSTYLPLSGGTLTGILTIEDTVSNNNYIQFRANRIGSESYADNIINIADSSNTIYARFGIYGTNESLQYVFLGHNKYNGVNLRVYSDKVTFGDNIIYHSGNISTIKADLGLGTFAYKSSLAFADLTNKPTTISGYGITDAITTANIGSQSVASAAKLATARKIWGQSFDGTGDVDGTIKINSQEDIFEAITIHNDWYTTDVFKYTDIRLLSYPSGTRGGAIRVGTGNYGMFNSMSFGKMENGDSYTPYMFINSSGYVGIGTTSPEYKHHIIGESLISQSANGNLFYRSRGVSYELAFGLGSGGTNRGIYDFTNNSWMIYRDGTTNVLIPNGNVGIGTNSPSYKLHVNGTAGISGSVTLTGTDYTTAMLKFSRSSVNYIIFPSDGSIGFATAIGTANISVRIDSTGIRPYSVSTTRETFLGDATYRWAGTYSVLGNFSGLITASGGIELNTIQAPTSSGGTTYGPGTNGQVLKSNGTTVYWAADNNSNTKVTQTISTSDADYRVLFSVTADDTTRTEGARKSTNLKFNPSTGTLTATTFSGALSGNATTATTASKLSTVSKKAWGQTYWTSGGIPTSISGDMLAVGNITISATGNKDYFINFLYNSTPTYSWRLGYLGTGAGNANYFVIDSSKSSGGTWHRVLQLGNETLEAVFSGSVTATSFIGDLNNTLTFAAGTFSATSYNNGSAVTVNIPTSKSHVGLGNVQNTAFYKRVTTINGTGWNMAGTNNEAAFTIYAPTTAGTSGQYLVSSGGTPSWTTINPYDANISRTANTVLAAPNGSNGSATFRTLVAADIPNLSASKITSGTLGVARGGTGATTFTSGAALIGAGTGAITTRSITNMTSVGYINYNTNLMTTNTLAYWNGAYSSGNGSNLAYCNKGAFGTIVTKNTGDYATASHTHSYAGSSSAGGAATSSNKVNFQAIGSLDFNAMVGDTYRGTFWYGGGSNTAANNPLGEGTAFGMMIWRNASGYTNQMIMSSSGKLYLRNYSSSSWAAMKTVAFTSDIPSSLKCPSSLTIQANGTSLGSYDGSSAKTFNITYSNVGAAAASHTHSYAGSSSAGGAASTVVCSAATSDSDRPIVGTNKSNQIYYTTKTTVNWSTGKITAPTINLNVAAGTAPISCTSTTVCTNLNAGLWDGYHLSVVSTLPSSPGSTTIYFVTG